MASEPRFLPVVRLFNLFLGDRRVGTVHRRMATVVGAVIVLAMAALQALPSNAQDAAPRFGFGTSLVASTADDLGFGIMGRVSVPLNADVSIGLDASAVGFVLGGRDDSRWVLTPQISAIVTLPGALKAPYILAGFGGYIPTTELSGSKGGPTIHAGIGWVRQLTQSTLYYEFDPSLIIEASEVEVALPMRIGIIF